MKKIELILDGVAVNARLLEEEAPKTCAAILQVLPFETLVIHSRWAGGRLHSLTNPNLNLGEIKYPFIENPSFSQAPGDVLVWPLNNEIMVTYSPGKFQWMSQSYLLTHFASIESDMSKFSSKIERLQWEGAKKLKIRELKSDALPYITKVTGPRFKIECEGNIWIGELFNDELPDICSKFLKALPLEGPITNTHGSGDMIHFWASIMESYKPKEELSYRYEMPIEFQGKKVGISYIAYYEERGLRGVNPGDIFLHSMGDIRIVHGQSFQEGMPTKFARIVEGDIGELHNIADRVQLEGAKVLRMSELQ